MRLPEHWEGWAAGALLLAALVWYTTAGQKQTWPAGTEDLDMLGSATGLPSEFAHWSPVSWAGRCRPYPAAWYGQIGALVNKQLPDYADMDG
jgi:hypothetical protein